MFLVGMVEVEAHPAQKPQGGQIVDVDDLAEAWVCWRQVESPQPDQLTKPAHEIERNRLLERKAGRPWAERRLGRGCLERLDRRSPWSALHVDEREVPVGRANHHIRANPVGLVEHTQRQHVVAAHVLARRLVGALVTPSKPRRSKPTCSERYAPGRAAGALVGAGRVGSHDRRTRPA